MFLVMGLGNPDKKYHNTYHNIGFMVVDRLAEMLDAKFDKGECRAITAHCRQNGEKVILAKPITYMNLSGESALELINKYKIERERFIVVYDDADLPVGNVRIRYEGSAGSHNGMKSIVNCVHTNEVCRIRIGIGKPDSPKMDMRDFVLAAIDKHTLDALDPCLDRAATALKEFVSGSDILTVMEKYNLRLRNTDTETQ